VNNRILAVACIALAVVVVALGWRLWSQSDDLRIDRPEWMPKPSAPSAEPAAISTVRDTPADLPAPTLAQEMVPPAELAAALTETKQKVTFSAEALIDAGIAKDVAESMRTALERYQSSLDFAIREDRVNRGRRIKEFFFAMWPELPELILQKKVTPQIFPIPREHNTARDMVLSIYDETNRKLEFVMNSENWQLVLAFKNDANNPFPELFEAIQKESVR